MRRQKKEMILDSGKNIWTTTCLNDRDCHIRAMLGFSEKGVSEELTHFSIVE